VKYTSRPCSQCGAARAFVDGAWLRKQRKDAGLSLREVARRLGYTVSYLCDLELDRRNVKPTLAKRILAALESR
jgi:transcriptional regulator with XRE-family HTH domain